MGVHVNSRGEHAETASDGTGPDRCFEVVRPSLAPSARLVAEHKREQAEHSIKSRPSATEVERERLDATCETVVSPMRRWRSARHKSGSTRSVPRPTRCVIRSKHSLERRSEAAARGGLSHKGSAQERPQISGRLAGVSGRAQVHRYGPEAADPIPCDGSRRCSRRDRALSYLDQGISGQGSQTGASALLIARARTTHRSPASR
jgi:hypothetical protein